MTPQRLRPIHLNTLLDSLFTGDAQELRADCADWCAASPRFAVFLETHRDKIRKKLRLAADAEGMRDVQEELRTAACLLSERAFTLDYEPYAANKVRGPDFGVLFKSHVAFNVEVKRIRGQAQAGKWADVLCDKLGQLPPSVSNVLVISSEPVAHAALFDVAAAMAHLRATAERKDEAFFTRRGMDGSRAYLRQLFRLSAVVLRGGVGAADGTAPVTLWLNPQARHPLAPELVAALRRSLEAL